MFAGNAAGEVLPPYVVYKSKKFWNTWVQGGPKGCRFNRSKPSWFEAAFFHDWFTLSLLPRLKKLPGKKVVIGDNLSSHFDVDIIRHCEKEKIIFLALIPNSTHVTQPLDVALFRPMKVKWRQILTRFETRGEGRKKFSLPKEYFPRLLKELTDSLMDTKRAQDLISGFAKSGIVPLDRTKVLSRLPLASSTEGSVPVDVLNKTVFNMLTDMRGTNEPKRTAKKKRLDVPAGKSYSVEEIRFEASETEEAVTRMLEEGVHPDQKAVVQKGKKIPHKRNKEPEPESSSEDERVGIEICNHLNRAIFFQFEYKEERFPGEATQLDPKKKRLKIKAMTMAAVKKWEFSRRSG
ncbi:hypothetical protein QYM36_011737 [Artemia franciscana]|uniref:DDE-1 domain-containing protein n=1 Tax=Artemia franciscana TaxID=6661 RepID=A0AA88L551_ARTSF|nr:hypothetical protein QYM36_011737 [Artemia franciscana]